MALNYLKLGNHFSNIDMGITCMASLAPEENIATMGLAPAIFGPLMDITCFILTSYWYKRPPNKRGL
jgi:hypothetical protein